MHFLLTPETGYTRFSIGYTNKMQSVTGDAMAGIIDESKGLLGDGGNWHSLAVDFAAFAASQREDWQTAVENVEYCDKLKFWLKDKLLLIKNTKN